MAKSNRLVLIERKSLSNTAARDRYCERFLGSEALPEILRAASYIAFHGEVTYSCGRIKGGVFCETIIPLGDGHALRVSTDILGDPWSAVTSVFHDIKSGPKKSVAAPLAIDVDNFGVFLDRISSFSALFCTVPDYEGHQFSEAVTFSKGFSAEARTKILKSFHDEVEYA